MTGGDVDMGSIDSVAQRDDRRWKWRDWGFGMMSIGCPRAGGGAGDSDDEVRLTPRQR